MAALFQCQISFSVSTPLVQLLFILINTTTATRIILINTTTATRAYLEHAVAQIFLSDTL